jgi:hypothetical protein
MPTYYIDQPIDVKIEMTLKIEVIQSRDGSQPEDTLTLRELRKMLGGDEGFIDDISGKKHRVSLKKWENVDQDKIFFAIGFVHKGHPDPAKDPVFQAMEKAKVKKTDP